MGDDRLAPLWEALGWHPDPEQQALFAELQNLLRHWNAQLNLTRLVEGEDFWIAQVYDSLWPLADLLRTQPSAATAPLQLVDVGTGGGFPGLALAIALPGAEVCLIDSVQRKVEAVRAMAGSLGLGPRVRFCSERVEKLGRAAPWRGGFDWAVARAVAPAPVVAEYLVPLLKANGQALLYRGQWSDDDQRRLSAAARSLNATIAQISRCELPAGRGQRTAIVLKPRQGCPRQYPRAVGIPAKQPLGGVSGAATCA